MDASHELSVGELIEHLLADSLIDAGHITGESVTVVQGAERHSFPYDQARTFLMGMVRGRSWNRTADEPERVASRSQSAGGRKEESDAAGESSSDFGDRRSDARLDDPPSLPGPVGVEMSAHLDDLLAMADDMGLVESASKDAGTGAVTIRLSSCETRMSLDEGIVFLAECILNGLNALRTVVMPQPGSESDTTALAYVGGAAGSPDRSATDRSAGDDAASPGGAVAGKPAWKPLSGCVSASGIV